MTLSLRAEIARLAPQLAPRLRVSPAGLVGETRNLGAKRLGAGGGA